MRHVPALALNASYIDAFYSLSIQGEGEFSEFLQSICVAHLMSVLVTANSKLLADRLKLTVAEGRHGVLSSDIETRG
jgi:hypothetical protein